MKKLIISCLVALVLLGTSPQLVNAEKNLKAEPFEIISRSTTIRKWFPKKPDPTYRGKKLVHSYKSNKGYIGVYQ